MPADCPHLGVRAGDVLSLDHNVVVLDGHRHRFRHIGPGHQPRSRLHGYRIAARPHTARVAPGLPGTDVELPAVPGAADDLARARIAVAAGLVGLHRTGLPPGEQAAAAVRAAVVQREELAAEIEHHDGAAVDLREPARARRNG